MAVSWWGMSRLPSYPPNDLQTAASGWRPDKCSCLIDRQGALMNRQNPMLHRSEHEVSTSIASTINIVAGVYLLASPWYFGVFAAPPTWNSMFCGMLLTVLAVTHLSLFRQTWMSWINAAVGLWTIVSPWVFGFSANRDMMLNGVVIGAIVLLSSLWAISSSPRFRG